MLSSKKELKKSLKNSLRDLVVVILGIFIGVQVDNLKDNILSIKKERTILSQIEHSLLQDINDMDFNIKGHTLALKSDSLLLFYIENKLIFRKELIYHFPKPLLDFVLITNTGAYETLKSIGMDLIRDDSLRLCIAELYDFYYEKLNKFEEEFYPAQSYNRFFKYFSINFKMYNIPSNTRSSVNNSSAYPINYDKLINDPEYQILLQEDILWRKVILDRYFTMKKKASSLISKIRKELS